MGWNVLSAGVSHDGQWLVGPGALERLWSTADPHRLPRQAVDVPPVVPDKVEVFDGPPPVETFAGHELALPVCHGRWGEDGALQGLLRSYGIPIVGCDVAASAICYDKHLARSVLAAAGLPVAAGVRVRRRDFYEEPASVTELVRTRVGAGPWFVKPARGGSSLGIGRATSVPQLNDALMEALRWDDAALVEDAVPHREVVLGVLGARDPVISPPGECIAVGELYTYEEKYRLGNPLFTCPAALDDRQVEHARELAAAAFHALGCSVFARVDLFLDERTGEFLINEVNTIPGMTATSVFPKVMKAAGYGYRDLLAELCRIAAAQ